MAKILPVFQESSFRFEGEIPEHIEQYPDVPNYPGLLAVYTSVDGGSKTYPLALDIPSERLARKLAEARARELETTLELYGYTDDVVIQFPDGNSVRTYIGRSAE